jgi:hypothetical protein
MRRTALMLGATALIFAAADAQAQDKPNFTGTWTEIADPNAAPAGGGRGGRGGMGLGAGATITQDAAALTITRTTQAGEVKSVYKLDGSASTNTVTMGGNSMDQVSKAAWNGNTLVITTTMNMGGNEVESTMSLSLDASGNLSVTTNAPGRGGGMNTTTRNYKKG